MVSAAYVCKVQGQSPANAELTEKARSASMVIWIQASQGSNMDQVPTLFLLAFPLAHLVKLYSSPRTRVRDDCAFNNDTLVRHNWARRWITVAFQVSLFTLVIFSQSSFVEISIDAHLGAPHRSQRRFTFALTNNNRWLPRHPLIQQLAQTSCAELSIN